MNPLLDSALIAHTPANNAQDRQLFVPIAMRQGSIHSFIRTLVLQPALLATLMWIPNVLNAIPLAKLAKMIQRRAHRAISNHHSSFSLAIHAMVHALLEQ